jgi:hypothetical protein
MQKDCCSNKWFCPSIVGVTAGLIMIAAGATKFLAGKAMLTGVGGMALGVFGVAQGEMASLALTLGVIAATVELLGGLSFALGCRKTSRWAAFFLSGVMGIAILFKLKNLQPLEGNLFDKAAGLLVQIRLDLLLFAVFFTKALKLIMKCCGMGCSSSDACCTMEAPKK